MLRECGTYLEIMDMERDPLIEPVADETADGDASRVYRR